ncbi:MAG: transcription-repair coupling factor [Anaerolineaceae bacterium]|nr:transcription-repair coupling factor [Anaerolineaceae bacterium]
MLDEIRSLKPYQALLEDLRAGVPLTGQALPRAARLPVAEALRRDLNRPVLLLTDRADHALLMADELSFWSNGAPRMYFPEPNPLFYEQAAWGTATRRDRLQVLTLLATYHIPGVAKPEQPPIIVASVRAIMTRTLPRRDFLKSSRTIKVGQVIAPETLRRAWADLGYQHADTVLEPGQFTTRGGLMDVWTAAEPYPVRMEFFGDEIDTLRAFDPATQRTVRSLESLLVTPAREVLPGKAAAVTPEGEDLEEFYLPLAHSMPASLLDYLPQNALVLVDDLENMHALANEIEEQAVKLRADSIAEGTLAADFPVPYIPWSELQDMLSGRAWLELGRSTAGEHVPLSECFSPGPRYGGRMKSFLEYVTLGLNAGERVEIVSRQTARIRELWTEQAGSLSAAALPVFTEGTLSEGWVLRLPDARGKLHLLTDSEIFGWDRPQPRLRPRSVAAPPEAEYTDLRAGDYVVHVDYGVGRYVGLMRRMLDGAEREYLCVEYDSSDQIFVPVYQADRLSRYVGPGGEPPQLTRLGGTEWANVKQRVRESVLEVAQELLDLYARRQVAQGHAFQADSAWQQDLEASFPYIETEDQLKAIEAVKRDMERIRPMDRLLCGDVGYGKTEVALRAAFKSVTDGKQVAVLVPTTVLAQQHYETFRQRLAAFPVTVEMLSRFRNPREQDRIVKSLVTGGVDIIIGTHRLLQPDVQFKDLGLVVIDEEQRFGVTHKEHFKKLRTTVDVLTMTATPIPRTLYMALTGVRDISQISTPPAERLPVITHIGPYSQKLARQAILREIERGGQVFFVHNRVQTIRGMEQHLNNLVPEARVGVAHGQMHEDQLSKVMTQFTKGEIDVLLCTSIIESGLDIPNANTLIVDRGDTFGLAQLYQLRGRVGRGAQRAYAYFFRHKRRPTTVEGLERLEVIAENTQLGAGYSIAMRDLEMRGAGEMLGTRQHGVIASVGFHLYTRMLAQAVRQLRQAGGIKPAEDEPEVRGLGLPVSVDLPLGIGIPAEYIPDQNLRLKLYRRLAGMEDAQELEQLHEEFVDRFGVLPEAVQNLFYQMRVKLRAQKVGLASVAMEGEQVVLRFPPLPEGMTERNLPAVTGVRTGRNAYWMAGGADWQERLMRLLTDLEESCQPYC